MKEFIPIILTLFYGLQFNFQPVGTKLYGEANNEDWFVIIPVVYIIILVKICAIYSTKFWISGYIIIPIWIALYQYQMVLHDLIIKEFLNTSFICFPNFCILAQLMFTVEYITELKQISIFFRSNQD